ncbi:hypothetical protein C2G38_2247734 [Gigaspora rosea]|uniref:Uncharacterized protein n=1 Tax=Gigaspora rosea TaxID=44941 RepID=A0A397UZY4_9GLOM|nr:hypothetical protein C2G38_2247734 [Gigaspora rosea]
MGHIHKEYYSANATYLSDEAIKEIKESPENQERKQQIRNTNTTDWNKEIESIYDLYAELPKSTYLTSEQIETIRSLKDKVPKYRIVRDFHINEHRIDDIWEGRERQQQIIQNTISTEILPEYSNQIESVLLQNKPLGDESEIRDSVSSLNYSSSNLHLESTTLNTEIKKRSSKSRSKSGRISDPIPSCNSIPVNTDDSTKKISSEKLDALYEKEAKRDEKNKVNMNRLLAT